MNLNVMSKPLHVLQQVYILNSKFFDKIINPKLSIPTSCLLSLSSFLFPLSSYLLSPRPFSRVLLTPLATILHLLPVFFPFLAPGKIPITSGTGFGRKIMWVSESFIAHRYKVLQTAGRDGRSCIAFLISRKRNHPDC